MDLGNTTTNLGYGMSRMPYQPTLKSTRFTTMLIRQPMVLSVLLVLTCMLILVRTMQWRSIKTVITVL